MQSGSSLGNPGRNPPGIRTGIKGKAGWEQSTQTWEPARLYSLWFRMKYLERMLMTPLHPVIQDENYPDQVTQHGQDNDNLDFTEGIIQKSSDFPEHREWVC